MTDIHRSSDRCTALLLALSLLLALTACGGGTKAATMHLKRTEGTVAVSDGAGKDVPLLEDLGLYSGYGVDTSPESFAWIDLDDVKLTKMDQDSQIAIQKEGRDLEIEVISGSLFFNVTEPLERDEIMTIRTSTMIAGIRGTCGWAALSEDGEQLSVYLLEGKVRCETDGEKETVRAGEMAVMTRDGRIEVSPFTARDVPAFVLDEVREDEDLCAAILEAAGLDLLEDGGDSALTAALGRIAYYGGDPSRCTMTPEQAAAFAQVIRDNMAQLDAATENYLLDENGELFINGVSWGTPAEHPTLSTAALFDLGDGTPALIFGGAVVNRIDDGAYHWLSSGIRGIWLYQDGAVVQFAPGQSHQAIFDGYLLTSDTFGPPYTVYPIENGAVASHPSTWAGLDEIRRPGSMSEPEYRYYIDSTEVSRGAFDAWVEQWAHTELDPDFQGILRWKDPQSPVGFAGSTDIAWSSWGMSPAEDLLAVLEELAEGYSQHA